MIFGKYQLLEILGRGGMAEVYKAKSYGVEGFEKLLVIKRILPNLTDNERFVEMFINEAKIAVSLNHANIVQVFDLGKVGDSYYIAMEFVQGLDLANIIKACRRYQTTIPPELAAFIGSEVAKGLDYAHRRRDQNLQPLNIVHRDISPHNILISYEGEVKLTDFGIARAKNTLPDKDRSTIKGKYAYMAPEQARGGDHDRRVDIFSLGVVLYELISGSNPFKNGSTHEIIRTSLSKSYPKLNEIEGLEQIPEEIAEIVARAMDPRADKRFAGASELYESLIAFLYNTGTRVGAHTLTAFLRELGEEGGAYPPTSAEKPELIAAFAGSGTLSSIPPTSPGEAVDEAISDITSIQVPTTGTGDDAHTTGTGSRSLAAEIRDVTLLAMELIGPPMPPSLLERFEGIITENGGTVVEKRNDLIIGVFGLEVADGKDTQDAVDTALKIQRAALIKEQDFTLPQVGVGVYPDKIVLMSTGAPREDDTYFAAVSAARNLAKRGVGCVITSETGKSLATGSYHFEELTNTSTSGSEATAYKVVGRRPVTETYGRMFGRREELRSIGEILAYVSSGTGRTLALVGDAGTGKTRILHEVKRRLLSGGHDVGWYEATCVPWRHSSPFSAVAAMFRSILGVGEIESEDVLRAKVERLRELGLIPEEIEAVSVLLGLHSAGDAGPDERSRQLRSSLIRASSSLAADKMTILFWDDLAYVDTESFEIIEHLARSIEHLQLLLALAHRPGSEVVFEESETLHKISLTPLSESESKRLALSRMGARRAPEDLLVDIALKSGGNPLYIEEYVKALVAGNVVEVHGGEATYNPEASLVDVPKTLRGLVGARIKRLPIEQRGILQRAAVMGQRFNIELLSNVTGVDGASLRPSLQGLKEAGLINRISTMEYAFVSDLVRDGVYDGIVFSDRKEIHACVAQAIEEMFSERIDEFVERLAVHYREGGERKKAVDFLIRAGHKVAADYSHQAALDYYLKALELLHNVPRPDMDRILSVYLPIGHLAIKTNALSLGREKMRLAEELAEDVGDKRKLVQIMRLNAELQARSDRYLESQQYFQRAIELADELEDRDLECEVRAIAGQVYIWLGDMKKAAPFYREVIELMGADPEADVNLLVTAMSQLAKTETNAGDFESAGDTLKRTENLLPKVTNPTTRCEFEEARGQLYYMNREMEKSISVSMRALDIAKEYDMRDMVAKNAHNIGDAYLVLGDFRKAFTYLRMSQELAQEIEFELLINLNNIFLSFIDALKFGSNEGLAQLEKALYLANERNTIWEQVQVHYFLGRIYFERNQFTTAQRHLEQSLRIGRAADNRIYESQVLDLLKQIEELADDSLLEPLPSEKTQA